MRRAMAVVVVAAAGLAPGGMAAGGGAAWAQAPTPGAALGAETRLNRELEQDRQRDRARDLRGPIPEVPSSMRAMEDDRRSLGPDVGRPEAEGRMEPGGERGALTGGMNPQR